MTWKRGGSVLEAIPVFVDLGSEGDMRRLGLDEETLADYVLSVLDAVNRAAVTAPRLYFGGFRSPRELVRSAPDGSGLHIRASRCSVDDECSVELETCNNPSDGDPENNTEVDCSDDLCAPADTSRPNTNRARIRLRPLLDVQGELCPVLEPWNTVGAESLSPGVEMCAEPSPGVIHPVKGYCIPFKDFSGVLLHEVLHALGLDHSEWDQETCEEKGGIHSGDPRPTWGVVRTALFLSEGAGRILFRDDVEGLRSLYGKLADWPESWKVVEYSSEDGVEWQPVGVVPLAQKTSVPVAASSATDPKDPFLVLAYAGADGLARVAVRAGEEADDWQDLGAVDPTTKVLRVDGSSVLAGVTFQPPAAAYASKNTAHPARIAVAWVFEDELDEPARLRWAIRDRQGGPWTLNQEDVLASQPIQTKFRRVGLGYDPVLDVFLLSYLDSADGDDPRGYGRIWAVDPKTGQLVGGSSESLALPDPNLPFGKKEILHDIGKPVCERFGEKARCVIPVATSGPDGPCMAWYYGFRFNFTDGFETLDRRVECAKSHGLADLALAPGPAKRMAGTLVSAFPGLDPVALPPPEPFNCAKEHLCATSPRTAARLVYPLAFAGGIDDVGQEPGPAGFDLKVPAVFDFIPGTSKAAPGPKDPGPWWPAAVGSLGGAKRPLRMFVADLDERCGNGLIEAGEQCDGADLDGATCEGFGLGSGDLVCTSRCTVDPSGCGPPGCDGLPGEPGCACLPVDDSHFCDLGEEECFPDGPGSFGAGGPDGTAGLQCPDGGVCGLRKLDGELLSICEACPDLPAQGKAPYGCPCGTDADCQPSGQAGSTTLQTSGPMVELACWGSSEQGWSAGPGTCLPKVDPGGQPKLSGQNEVEEFERTRWLCKVPCGALAESTNLAHHCLFAQPNLDPFHAVCVDEHGCDGLVAGECEVDKGGRCDPTDDDQGCTAECDPEENGAEGNPGCALWGFPAGYGCTTWIKPGRCVPAACVDDPLNTGVDSSWCRMFAAGGT